MVGTPDAAAVTTLDFFSTSNQSVFKFSALSWISIYDNILWLFPHEEAE